MPIYKGITRLPSFKLKFLWYLIFLSNSYQKYYFLESFLKKTKKNYIFGIELNETL